MDARMMATYTFPRLLLAGWLGVAGVAAAEPLPDPTRPPPEISAPEGAPGAEAAAARGSQGLQVVIIAPDHRAAIINGQMVKVGGKYGDATVVAVQEGSITLRDAHGRQVTLSMFPAVAIRRKEASPQGTERAPKEAAPARAEENTAPQAAPQEEK